MESPTFDADGYPTDETLDAIKSWPHDKLNECLDFVAKAWFYPSCVNDNLYECERETIHANIKTRYLRLVTGGWSGNEDLIMAMHENFLIRSCCWVMSVRGGLHIFKYL